MTKDIRYREVVEIVVRGRIVGSRRVKTNMGTVETYY